MPIEMDQHILWLQIPVQDLLTVQVFDCNEHLWGIEKYLFLRKPPLILQMIEKRTTALEIKQEVELAHALERVVQFENEGVSQILGQSLL